MPCLKNIQNSLNYFHSSLPTKVLLYCTILLIIILFEPTAAYCRLPPIDPRDAYIRKTINLDVKFSFNTSKRRQGSYSSKRNWSFNENYKLRLRDNIIDPRLIIYNAVANYSISNNSNDTTFTSFGIGASATILRKFRFPFTVYEYRNYTSHTITDSFGARAFLNFRRLPKTTIYTSWNRTENESNTTLTSSYIVKMTKDIGPTSNSLDYTYSTNSFGSNSSSVGLTNKTKLSRVTGLSGAITQHEQTSDSDSGYKKGMGYTMELASKISRNFKQRHSYAKYSSEKLSDGLVTTIGGQSYYGKLNFILSKKLSTTGTLSYSDNTTTTPSKESVFENLHANWRLKYILAKRIVLTTNTSYTRNNSNITSVITDESYRESFSTSAGIGYSRKIQKMSFSTAYSLGYSEQISFPNKGGGTGITQRASVSLGNIRYKKIVFNGNYRINRTDSLTGDVWAKGQKIFIKAKSLYWKKYGRMNSSFLYESRSSWNRPGADKTQTIRLYGNTRSFRKTSAFASHIYIKETIDYLSILPQKQNTTLLSVKHKRIIKKGLFTAVFRGTYKKNEHGRSLQRHTTANLNAVYRKTLLRRVNWISTFDYLRSRNLESKRVGSGMHISNTFVFSLRKWSLHARHILSLTSNNNSEASIEERFMITLKRSFIRKF